MIVLHYVLGLIAPCGGVAVICFLSGFLGDMNIYKRFRDSIERPLFDSWRVGMVLPLCFTVAYFLIHVLLDGDVINRRSWYALGGGIVLAVGSISVSRKLSITGKLWFLTISILAYPLLFIGSMMFSAVLDFFHCGFSDML